mmetsp:Transcript_14893/g.44883  ORF Transcript_14893/g.44883 Transcript_14893/m.44883 type:complete len:314 (+) Transcript_14893:3006-3947(+)
MAIPRSKYAELRNKNHFVWYRYRFRRMRVRRRVGVRVGIRLGVGSLFLSLSLSLSLSLVIHRLLLIVFDDVLADARELPAHVNAGRHGDLSLDERKLVHLLEERLNEPHQEEPREGVAALVRRLAVEAGGGAEHLPELLHLELALLLEFLLHEVVPLAELRVGDRRRRDVRGVQERAHDELRRHISYYVFPLLLAQVRRRELRPVPRHAARAAVGEILDEHVQAREVLRVLRHVRGQNGGDEPRADALLEAVVDEVVLLLLQQLERGGEVHVLERALVVILAREPFAPSPPLLEDEGAREAGVAHVVHEPGEN